MISDEARLRRSELFGEADTSALPAVEPTTDDEGTDDSALFFEHFSDGSKASELVASCELAQALANAKEKAATSAEASWVSPRD